ncbi:DNA polymerase I [Pseudobdellovibrio sp. HCB154]|uniref:DNA polymerase I n=1 Tax=Pseudobdellovibrio sp. HCB154 TaxID=3386277 RepID=UPI0039172BA1
MKKIYLVDVSSMFFRAFYAIRPLSSTKGVPVNAVYGFISMIVKLFKEKNPDHMVFCYDRKEPSFRKDLYTDYKANRTEMPDDLQVQMPYLKQVADLFGIADIEVAGYEADDLIGTIAKQAAGEGYQVYIVSGDKDFSQLVNENIFLYDTMKEFVYTIDAVKEKHGVYPNQFIDFLAITGDTSDHVPGVAGIGPKGAQKLIEQFGTLEQIYENIDKVAPAGVKEKLIKSKDDALISKKLVTIVTDVKTGKTMDDYIVRDFKTEELRAFLQDLNFKTFEKTLLGDGQTNMKKGDGHKISGAEPKFATPAAPGPTVSSNSSVAGELKAQTWDATIVQHRIKNEKFFTFTANEQICICFNNFDYFIAPVADAKLDYKNLTWSGFDIKKVWADLNLTVEDALTAQIDWDMMLLAYCLKSQDMLDPVEVVKDFLDVDLKPEAKQPVDIVKLVDALVQLSIVVQKEIREKDLLTIYEKLEKPLIPILYAMEKTGIKLDTAELAVFSKELADDLSKLETEIHGIAGEKFNIGSPKQLGVILFERLGLEVIKKTKTGYSTDNEVLEKLNHPIAQLLMSYRELSKLKSTYVDALPEMVDAHARLHTHFNQAYTATGRLSSVDPNLQNIPIKTEKGRKVRQAFIAEKGKKLLSLDYSQIELRVLAHISNDPGLIKAFQEDLDIHAATAAEVFGVAVNAVTKEHRRIAKAVNFGIAYGQGAYGLAETLGISRTESKDIIDRYFKKFSGIKDYIENTIEEAHQKKYVETLFGRRRYLTELDSTNAMVKKFGERAAINAPIQGTASDLMKMAMIDVQRAVVQDKIEVNLLLQVHDELIFEGLPEVLEMNAARIRVIMENVAKFKVPLKVNSSIGANWDQAH